MQEFIVFDVKINDNWQERENVRVMAEYFGINAVPVVLKGTLEDGVNFIKEKPFSQITKLKYIMEGIVGRPIKELKDRNSNRVIVKIKVCDFE